MGSHRGLEMGPWVARWWFSIGSPVPIITIGISLTVFVALQLVTNRRTDKKGLAKGIQSQLMLCCGKVGPGMQLIKPVYHHDCCGSDGDLRQCQDVKIWSFLLLILNNTLHSALQRLTELRHSGVMSLDLAQTWTHEPLPLASQPQTTDDQLISYIQL